MYPARSSSRRWDPLWSTQESSPPESPSRGSSDDPDRLSSAADPRQPQGRHTRSSSPTLRRRYRSFASIQLLRSVVVQLIQAYRQQLHYLTRVVLVRVGRRVALVVAQHRQKLTHHRVQRHILQQLPEVAERIRAQRVIVVGLAAWHVLHREVRSRNHEDLAQRILHLLPQFIVGRKRILPERILHVVLIAGVLHEQGRVALHVRCCTGRIVPNHSRLHARLHQRLLRGELLIQPRLVARQRHALNVAVGRAKRRLLQETRRVSETHRQ